LHHIVFHIQGYKASYRRVQQSWISPLSLTNFYRQDAQLQDVRAWNNVIDFKWLKAKQSPHWREARLEDYLTPEDIRAFPSLQLADSFDATTSVAQTEVRT
jgi:integrase